MILNYLRLYYFVRKLLMLCPQYLGIWGRIQSTRCKSKVGPEKQMDDHRLTDENSSIWFQSLVNRVVPNIYIMYISAFY